MSYTVSYITLHYDGSTVRRKATLRENTRNSCPVVQPTVYMPTYTRIKEDGVADTRCAPENTDPSVFRRFIQVFVSVTRSVDHAPLSSAQESVDT
eukprot:7633250-Pyramimonas_sp.AAC.3